MSAAFRTFRRVSSVTLRAALLSVLACSVAGCGTSVPAPTALPRAQPLTIDSVFPPSGRPGNPIRIYGTGLSGDTTVLIGNALAHKIEVLSSESITVESPVLEVGTVDVVITNPRGHGYVAFQTPPSLYPPGQYEF